MENMERKCFLCGANGADDPLDTHHIFPGPYRRKSDRYGLVVPLCHYSCHIFGDNAVHRNQAAMLRVKQYGQQQAMQEQGWSTQDFVREFGKNYL